jgi:integrase
MRSAPLAHGNKLATKGCSAFAADHLRPAATGAGVKIEPGQRLGLHSLRHSLSRWLVNKTKVDPKTVQSILRHSRIQTTLDLYTQADGDESMARVEQNGDPSAN